MCLTKQEVEEKIKSREIYIESAIKFIYNYIGLALESKDIKKMCKCNLLNLAVELEEKKSEITLLEDLLKQF